jgi:hypothetical protein
MPDAKSIEFLNILNMFRLPSLSNAPQITWAYSTPVCKNLEKFGDQTLPGIVNKLLHRLSKIQVTANQTPEDRQTILSCQAFAASTIFAASNLYSLKNLWKQLNFYHRSANIEFTDLLQMGMEILSEPYKEHPLRLFDGFNLQHCSAASWHSSTADFRRGQHPIQLYLKKKFMLLLIDRIRQCGAGDFKRTNSGLLKRTSQIKMREALSLRGNLQISMLVLHQVLVNMKDFYTPQPQEADYQRLHAAYQQALNMQDLPICSLQETQERLAELGSSIRSYSNSSSMQSLNEGVGEYGSELLDRLSNHHYSDPLENCLQLEQQEQAENLKQQVHQQLKSLSPIHMESFSLKASGRNDSQIAKLQSIGASSTVKRRRNKIISNFLNIPIDQNFAAVADIYLEVAQEYFGV